MSEWISRWAGSYTLISCSYWAKQYDEQLKKILGKGLDTTLFIHKKGAVSFFVKKDELDSLGIFLAKKTKDDLDYAKRMLSNLKNNTDVITKHIDGLYGKIPTMEEYNSFLDIFEKHLALHCFMKKTVDYLDKNTLEDIYYEFENARKYSEKVYSLSESFFRSLASAIGGKEKINRDILTCLTQHELEEYIKNQVLPKEEILQNRFLASAILFKEGKISLVIGNSVLDIEKKIFEKTMKGVCVQNGKVKGIARIILNPLKKNIFNEGDILITGMTRPEFLPLIQKASAIITDVGGKLCHAAIIAREMKIPCIVGMGNATKTIKEGDLIEVDAFEGTIKNYEVK
ncbi:PEP-utilizing enzyme [Desulfosarcina sp.]|nr:PEP-utilizing enzyme [Desulfosarcina sp.]